MEKRTVLEVLSLVFRDDTDRNSLLRFLTSAYSNLSLTSSINELVRLLKAQPVSVEERIRNYTSDKKALVKKLNKLFGYLKCNYGLGEYDWDFLNPDLYLEKDQRILEIIKFLQQGKKSRDEIAEHFKISPRALSNDLSTLQEGYDFQGYKMKITLNRDNTYDSTIHPIFLPLNLTEIFALTVGLKQVKSDDFMFKEIYNQIADMIYSQLSSYGQDKISKKAAEYKLSFSDSERRYRPESEFLSDNIDHYRNFRLAYFVKSGSRCTVEFMTDEEIIEKTGILHLSKSQERLELIKDGMSTLIEIKDITHIEFAK